MSGLSWLTDAQKARLDPIFPNFYGKPRVQGRLV